MTAPATTPRAVSALLRIPIGDIHPGPNVRGADLGDVTELAASLKAIGQQIPIVVEQLDDGRFQLVEGHRRRAAAIQAQMPHLDAIVRPPTTNAAARTIRQLAIQSHAKPFDPMTEARALHTLMFEQNMSREQIAQQVGRSPGWVRDRISLVHLAPDEQAAVAAGRLSVAEALLRLANRRADRGGGPPAFGRRAGRPATTTMPIQRMGLPYTSHPDDPEGVGVHVDIQRGRVMVAGQLHTRAAALELSAAIARAANDLAGGGRRA